jgi:hypothetical protein
MNLTKCVAEALLAAGGLLAQVPAHATGEVS